jgi:16S rRNA processing protein RimM
VSKEPEPGSVPAYLTIGTVASPRGLCGDVRVYPHTDWPERFKGLSHVLVGAGGKPAETREVERTWVSGSSVAIKLAGVDTLEAANALRGKDLLVAVDEAWPLPEGHYYHFQLLGLTVLDSSGRQRGTLVRIYPGPANDFYGVAVRDATGSEVLIPAVKAAVKSIDLQSRTMVVDWPRYWDEPGEPAAGTPPGGSCHAH